MIKTNLTGLFSTDRESEEEGIWVDVDKLPDGTLTRLKIRSFSAKAVSELREQLMRPYQMLQRTGAKVPDDVTEDVGLQVIAGAVIADWTGVIGEDDKGEPVAIPYTKDNALDLLKAMPRFANFVVQISMDGQTYKNGLREDGAKN